jgi:hypothetical protein
MPIFAPVFRALNEAGAPFLVIGGHAVVLHGHLRNTFDLVEPQPSPKSEDGSVMPDRPELLRFPTPPEPLREWTEQKLDPAVMIAAIEAVMQIARSQPDFEAQRLVRKTAVRFRY